MPAVSALRVRSCNTAPIRTSGRYVLYWMIASRRCTHNFALDRALEHCRALGRKPLVILEALRCDYPWASDRFESLPPWAKKTLQEHSNDERAHIYSPGEFESAKTHDPLWNAAQIQLVREGRIHNYLRMLWGRKILEWSRTPQEAVRVMIHLNDKYALDGCDPNSYGGIFWVLGRYDRPWGPERPIFGLIRYISSENAARKLSVKNCLRRHADRAKSCVPSEALEKSSRGVVKLIHR